MAVEQFDIDGWFSRIGYEERALARVSKHEVTATELP
jgi:hypothetical protein